ncbi:outer dense fiber protein 2-like [Achroia grisella]|uniref:outer dense fiber protein 2-like n=1 Tax=Achroia grisella TaxID=688607 RepID=UPI0027D1FB47|nr:outer dense fiber protein 2-like [Achroia grisella]
MLMPQSDCPFIISKASENVDTVNSSLLQKQLVEMEDEVKEIRMELAAIKRDRLDLVSKSQNKGISGYQEITKETGIENNNKMKTDFNEDSCGDYPGHPELEYSRLREELIRVKNVADQERFLREKYEGRLKDLEQKLYSICGTETKVDSKEAQMFSEEEVYNIKMKMKDLREEIEDMKLIVVEKDEQLKEYRTKYLQAQQLVEELKNQLTGFEVDNIRVSEQIANEIQCMKMQFQEKLLELVPLPSFLKEAKLRHQEARQFQHLAEENVRQLSSELQKLKDKFAEAVSNLNNKKTENMYLSEENKQLKLTIEEKQKKLDALNKKMVENSYITSRIEEMITLFETTFIEKTAQYTHRIKCLDEIKEETNRSLIQCKERADAMKQYMQSQISELERELSKSRALTRLCQKERDEIRQRMQYQVNNLQENFEIVETRVRALQNQVISLINNYGTMITNENYNNLFD